MSTAPTYILENGEVALRGGRDILEDEKLKSIYLGGRTIKAGVKHQPDKH